MASNISNIAFRTGGESYHKPIEHGGAVYVIGLDTSNNYELHCTKSTTPSTGSWSEQDASNAPAHGTFDIDVMAYSQNENDSKFIDVAWVIDNSGDWEVSYARFNMDTDVWVGADEALALETTNIDFGFGTGSFVDISSNSDDDLVILTVGDAEKEMGIDYARISIFRHNTGGSWVETVPNTVSVPLFTA